MATPADVAATAIVLTPAPLAEVFYWLNRGMHASAYAVADAALSSPPSPPLASHDADELRLWRAYAHPDAAESRRLLMSIADPDAPLVEGGYPAPSARAAALAVVSSTRDKLYPATAAHRDAFKAHLKAASLSSLATVSRYFLLAGKLDKARQCADRIVAKSSTSDAAALALGAAVYLALAIDALPLPALAFYSESQATAAAAAGDAVAAAQVAAGAHLARARELCTQCLALTSTSGAAAEKARDPAGLLVRARLHTVTRSWVDALKDLKRAQLSYPSFTPQAEEKVAVLLHSGFSQWDKAAALAAEAAAAPGAAGPLRDPAAPSLVGARSAQLLDALLRGGPRRALPLSASGADYTTAVQAAFSATAEAVITAEAGAPVLLVRSARLTAFVAALSVPLPGPAAAASSAAVPAPAPAAAVLKLVGQTLAGVKSDVAAVVAIGWVQSLLKLHDKARKVFDKAVKFAAKHSSSAATAAGAAADAGPAVPPAVAADAALGLALTDLALGDTAALAQSLPACTAAVLGPARAPLWLPLLQALSQLRAAAGTVAAHGAAPAQAAAVAWPLDPWALVSRTLITPEATTTVGAGAAAYARTVEVPLTAAGSESAVIAAAAGAGVHLLSASAAAAVFGSLHAAATAYSAARAPASWSQRPLLGVEVLDHVDAPFLLQLVAATLAALALVPASGYTTAAGMKPTLAPSAAAVPALTAVSAALASALPFAPEAGWLLGASAAVSQAAVDQLAAARAADAAPVLAAAAAAVATEPSLTAVTAKLSPGSTLIVTVYRPPAPAFPSPASPLLPAGPAAERAAVLATATAALGGRPAPAPAPALAAAAAPAAVAPPSGASAVAGAPAAAAAGADGDATRLRALRRERDLHAVQGVAEATVGAAAEGAGPGAQKPRDILGEVDALIRDLSDDDGDDGYGDDDDDDNGGGGVGGGGHLRLQPTAALMVASPRKPYMNLTKERRDGTHTTAGAAPVEVLVATPTDAEPPSSATAVNASAAAGRHGSPSPPPPQVHQRLGQRPEARTPHRGTRGDGARARGGGASAGGPDSSFDESLDDIPVLGAGGGGDVNASAAVDIDEPDTTAGPGEPFARGRGQEFAFAAAAAAAATALAAADAATAAAAAERDIDDEGDAGAGAGAGALDESDYLSNAQAHAQQAPGVHPESEEREEDEDETPEERAAKHEHLATLGDHRSDGDAPGPIPAAGSVADADGDADTAGAHVAGDDEEQRNNWEIATEFVRSALVGETFLKHGRMGKPHERMVVVRIMQDNRTVSIDWGTGKMVFTKQHVRVVEGKQTKVMQKSGKHIADDLCMSIITAERTLDLQARTVAERNYWLNGMRVLISFLWD
jgi:hypothetical protein